MVQPRATKVEIGKLVVLVCEYGGHPHPSIHWIADGSVVDEGKTVFTDYNVSVVTLFYSSTLRMFDLEGTSRRSFSCWARNSFSLDKKTFTVECKFKTRNSSSCFNIFFLFCCKESTLSRLIQLLSLFHQIHFPNNVYAII